MAGDLAGLLGGGKKKPAAAKNNVARKLARQATPDPLADVEVTGNLEDDTLAELDALSEAFRERAAREQDRLTDAMDSQFWLCLCFRSTDDVTAFLRAAGIEQLGDKYLDGHKVAAVLGVDMSGADALRKHRTKAAKPAKG
jgi:hypothetical protein